MAVGEVPRGRSSGVDVAQPGKVVAVPVDTDIQGIPIVATSYPGHVSPDQLSVEWRLEMWGESNLLRLYLVT